MAQINWVYLDDRGGRHRVGLFHGDRTGHLLIHCNRRIVQVDFSVRETRTYSFFVEDELCEVIAEKMKNGRFGYEFRVNKTIDTPRNRIRRVDNRRNNKLLALFVIGVVALITAIVIGLIWYGGKQALKKNSQTSIVHNPGNNASLRRLATEGRRTVSLLHLEEINGKQVGVYVFKLADSSEVRGIFPVADTGQILLPNGFPLSPGDGFATFYLPSNPQVHRVELLQPHQPTIQQYIKLAFEVEQREHPTDSAEKSLCRILTVAELRQWMVLADFIFQEKTPDQNPRNNRLTYLRLIRTPELAKAVELGCWDK